MRTKLACLEVIAITHNGDALVLTEGVDGRWSNIVTRPMTFVGAICVGLSGQTKFLPLNLPAACASGDTISVTPEVVLTRR